MFDCEFRTVADADLIAAIEDCHRVEAATAARRLAAIAELTHRRVADDDDDPRAFWVCDGWDSASGEVAAAMNLSTRRATGQMRIAQRLRDHLPLVAALFRRGDLSARVVNAITWRTQLITDEAVWALIDARLARRAVKWGPLAEDKLVSAVDALVLEFDKDALLQAKRDERTRDFFVGDREDENGVTSVWGRLNAADAAVLKKTLAAIADTVCDNDPRTMKERRADAMGALTHGNDYLLCRCGSPTCPSAGPPTPKSSVVVTVYTDQATLDGLENTAPSSTSQTPALPIDATPSPAPAAPVSSGTALLSGTEVLPTPLLAELLRNGAKLRPLCTPGDAQPESRYRPSAMLARFVRARDLTCRFPGCTTPAESCDIDHVIPYPLGPTHPSNLACLCRKHHLLKTFWTGDWELQLRPDGAAVWTSPTGNTYTTYPGSRSFFPDTDTDTGPLPPAPAPQTFGTDRGLMMPQRQRTRATDRAARIKAERQQNNTIRTPIDPGPPKAEPPRDTGPPITPYDPDPPPF